MSNDLKAVPHVDGQGIHHPPIWDLVDDRGLIVATVYTGQVVAEWIARKCNTPEPPTRRPPSLQ